MANHKTVEADKLDIQSLMFEDLRCMYGTGRSYIISGTGRNRKMGYRNGIQTNVGDIEVSEWKALMEKLIHRVGEEMIFDGLLRWVSQNSPWLHTKQEYELAALELHSMRIFENPKWVGYTEFQEHCNSAQADRDAPD